jgi:hypothetical protein
VSDASDAWLPLVVDEGQPARTDGLILRLGRELCVLADGGTVLTSNGAVMSASPIVGLRPATSAVDLDRFEGRRVAAAGILEDRSLVVYNEDLLAPLAEPGRGSRASMTPGAGFEAGGDSQRVPVRPAAEKALMEEGLLLDIWQAAGPAGAGARIALATDVQAVRAGLSQHYGDSLEVVQSRWSEATLREGESILCADGLAWSVGRDIGPDLQMRVTATLLHLPTRLARRLEKFPPQALDIEFLLRPA